MVYIIKNRMEATSIEEVAREVVEEKKEKLLRDLSDEKLAKVLLDATEELSRRYQESELRPENVMMEHLLMVSKGNAQALLSHLKTMASQLGIEKRYIQKESSTKKLLKRVLAAFSAAVASIREKATFSNVFNLYSVYRFGFTPHLIRAAAARSGLSLLGISYGMVAIGLTGRFLWIHPEILSLLKKLQNPSEDLIENVDLFVLAAALKDTVIHEISYILKDGLAMTSIGNDIKMIKPFLTTSSDYIGWSAATLEFMMTSDAKDVARSFVYWLQQKTALFSYIVDAANVIKEQAVKVATKVAETVSEVKEKAVKTAQIAAGKVYQVIVDQKKREEALEYGREQLRAITEWWYGKEQDAVDVIQEAAQELDYIERREEPVSQASSYRDQLVPSAQLSYNEPSRIAYSGKKKKW